MSRPDKIRLTRRDMLKLGAGGAGMFMLSAGGLAVPRGFAGGGGGGGGIPLHRGVPDQPADPQAVQRPADIPKAMASGRPARRGTRSASDLPDPKNQDCLAVGDAQVQGPLRLRHRLRTSCGRARAHRPATSWTEHRRRSSTRSRSQVAGHEFTSSPVQPINSFGKNVTPPRQRRPRTRATCRRARSTASTGRSRARGSTPSTGAPSLVRFENHLRRETTATTARTSARRTTRS